MEGSGFRQTATGLGESCRGEGKGRAVEEREKELRNKKCIFTGSDLDSACLSVLHSGKSQCAGCEPHFTNRESKAGQRKQAAFII